MSNKIFTEQEIKNRNTGSKSIYTFNQRESNHVHR